MLEAAYNLFVKVVSLSAMASVLTLLILAARFLLKDRLKPAWTYLLWIPLAARLVIPWTPESVFSIFNLLPLEKEPAQTVLIPSVQPIDGLMPAAGFAGSKLSPQAVAQDGVSPANPAMPVLAAQPGAGGASLAEETPGTGRTLLHLLALLWLGGAMVMLGLAVPRTVALYASRRCSGSKPM